MIKKMLVSLFLLCIFALQGYALGFSAANMENRAGFQKERVKPDYEIKAAFIVRFIDYVEWPAETGLKARSKPFILGVIGDTPITPYLETQIALLKSRSKKVILKRITTLNEVINCHILFISKSFEQNIEKIINITSNKPILTIGDTEGYARRGVHINLYKGKESVRFEINESALRSSPLVVSSVLLKLSKIVEPLRRSH